ASLHTLHPVLHPLPSTCPLFSFNHTPPTEIYTLSLHDALPISGRLRAIPARLREAHLAARFAEMALRRGHLRAQRRGLRQPGSRSEEHTSELQSQSNLVCRLLLEKKKKKRITNVKTKKTSDT